MNEFKKIHVYFLDFFRADGSGMSILDGIKNWLTFLRRASINKRIFKEIVVFTIINIAIATTIASFDIFDEFIKLLNFNTSLAFDRHLISIFFIIFFYGVFSFYKSNELENYIIDHKRTEQTLLESEKKFRSFFNEVSDSIFLAPMKGNFFEVNEAACNKFGYTRDEFLQMSLLDLGISKEEQVKLTKEIIQKGSVIFEIVGHRKSGATLPIEMSAKIIEHEDRAALLAIARDISERKEAEEALIRAKAEAEAANHSKSEFLANMSHELRTPLNSVIGFSDMLKGQDFGELNKKQLKYADNISKSGTHLLELINGILDLSKVEAGKMELHPEKFNVMGAIEEVKSLSSPLAIKRNICLNTIIDEELSYIIADRTKFKQILYNLVSNAIKFTPKGGEVTISAGCKDNTIQVSIIDTGIGISKEDMDKLFKPFVQLNKFESKEQAGTGLGLALVKRFVDMHGGDMSVESELNKGSTFSFSIPLNQENKIVCLH